MIGPRTPETVKLAAVTAIHLARCSGSHMAAIMIHTLPIAPAKPAPWTTRIITSWVIVCAIPAAAEAIMNTTRAQRMTVFRPATSDSFPTMGTITAPASAKPAKSQVNRSNPPISSTMFCAAVATTVCEMVVTNRVAESAAMTRSFRRYGRSMRLMVFDVMRRIV